MLEQARDLTPNDPDIQYHLAQALYMLGAKEQAVKILKKGARQKAEYAEQSQALALLDKIQLEMSE